MPSAPLLRYPTHSRYHSDVDNSIDLSPSASSSSRPPSPMLNALNEALTESILPSPPPPARLPVSFSASHALSRPPPLLSTVRCTYPTASLSAAHDPPLGIPTSISDPSSALLLTTPRVSPTHSPPTRSSLDTLRSIHTSAPAQITPTPTPSIGRWWFQSDPDAATKESVASVLDEEDLEGQLGKKFRAPKAPLVFCHGLLGFDSVTIGPGLQVSHWRGIKEVLEANGCEVLITRVPATSSPVDRAKVLEKKISETYPGRCVHLIGHSMGGLDCRYLTTHLTQRTFRVLSLTTIATPHHGSTFASHFLSLASTHLPSVLALLELLPNGGGDGKAFESLTREAMEGFNESTPDVEGVRYFSWGAEYEPGLIDTWKYPHSIISSQEGPNDGLVSVQSARWGTYLGTLRNANHLDLVGWTGGLAGNISSIAGLKMGMGVGSKGSNLRANVRGKEVGFSAGRFYAGVADLLAGVEEEEGLVVDGVWVGWEGREGRKRERKERVGEEGAKDTKEVKEGADGKERVGAEGIKRTMSDKERLRMEEMLGRVPTPPTSRSTSASPPPGERPLEMRTKDKRASIPGQSEDMDVDTKEFVNGDMTGITVPPTPPDSALETELETKEERGGVHPPPDAPPEADSNPQTPRRTSASSSPRL
ncbi:hypothetical protein HYDPIDRAFT_27736 [Hydnomerulius pinastri MD-312]|uniref:Uncharacterized protein n=1 Tax=Hydnomerulius pinastri MD-312 TaxID=994086 RepID=A0A0C9W217_9AGAM|nr:hypothetical protein HYDPIDRAFT_27736 [Hydnomerulius pinastri MD-312]